MSKKTRAAEVHGKSYSKVYRTWKNMKSRCTNVNTPNYRDYGGRGINVYPKWIESFNEFYSYVGDPPSDKHQLDRINTNGNYEPDNVRWAEQRNNLLNSRPRKNKVCKYKGVKVHKNRAKPYNATITINGVTKSLGYYKTAEEAALVYNTNAIEFFGKFAYLNTVSLEEED